MVRITTTLVCVSLACVGAERCMAQDEATEPRPNAPAAGVPKTDAEGVPLPPGVLASLGSTRWRHGAPIIGSGLSADGKRLATASLDSVAVWDLATGKLLYRFPTQSREERAQRQVWYSGQDVFFFSPDGKKLAYTCADSAHTGVWDLDSKGTFRRFVDRDNNHGATFCRFTPDGRHVVMIYDDGVQFYDPLTGKLRRRQGAHSVGAISADVGLYVQLDREREYRYSVCALETGAVIKRFEYGPEQGAAVFTPDSKTLVLIEGHKRKAIQIWAMPAAELRWTIPLPNAIFPIAGNPNVTREYCIGFSADSKVLMLGVADGTIHRWDLARKKHLPVLGKRRLGEMTALHELPGGKTLIVTTRDGLIRHWDIAADRDLFDLGNYQGSPNAIFAANGGLAAVGDNRGRVDVWDLRSVTLLRTLRTEGPLPLALAFARDGKTVAVGHEPDTVRLYDVASGRETKAIALHDKAEPSVVPTPSTVVFSPDGRCLCAETSRGDLVL
jgi:WD40 repeat protein